MLLKKVIVVWIVTASHADILLAHQAILSPQQMIMGQEHEMNP